MTTCYCDSHVNNIHQRRELQQQQRLMEEHFRVFQKRIANESTDIILAMFSSYETIPDDQREKMILHWPLSNNTSFTHSKLRRVPSTEYSEYFYFGFLCQFLEEFQRVAKKKKNNVNSSDSEERIVKKARTELVAPPIKPFGKIRLLEWSEVPKNLLDMRPGGQHQYHWPMTYINQYMYKSYFSLRSPRLLMKEITQTRIQLYYEGQAQFIACNCQIVITSEERFKGLTIHIPSQSSSIEFELVNITGNKATGHRTLDLSLLGKPDECCYIDSHGSQLLLTFGDRPGSLRLLTSTDDCHCALDIGSCELEYWSTEPIRYPIRYHLQESEILINISVISSATSSSSRLCVEKERRDFMSIPPVGKWCPQYRSEYGSFIEAMEIYTFIKELRMDWVKEIPYFFLQGKQLAVVKQDEHNYHLLFNGKSFTVFDPDPIDSEYDIIFAMRPSYSQTSFSLVDYYIY